MKHNGITANDQVHIQLFHHTDKHCNPHRMYQEILFLQPPLTSLRSLFAPPFHLQQPDMFYSLSQPLAPEDDNSLNNPQIDAVAATQHAEDDPSPTPIGISEFIIISNPLTS